MKYADFFNNTENAKKMATMMMDNLKLDKSDKDNKFFRGVYEKTTHAMMDYFEEKYESPIERVFGNTLLLGLMQRLYMVWPLQALFAVMDSDNPHHNDKDADLPRDLMNNFTIAFISPQYVSNKKRVDFAIYLWIPEIKKAFPLALECDGFEHHKKRFREDRIRDRELKKNEFLDVYRFSGSEIWTQPIEVSKEVVDWLDDKCEIFEKKENKKKVRKSKKGAK